MSPDGLHTFLALCVVSAAASVARAQVRKKPPEPSEGQAGKDIVWVATPPALVERMLDLACVTPRDFVIDLGSGDGRTVIAAAKRGARALGVEYNARLIETARRTAAMEGVGETATFVEADLFETDISQASVLALFLLPDNLTKLSEKFLALRPGSRIVTNRYAIEGWEPDEISRMDTGSPSCCAALLYVVPARVAGTWQLRGRRSPSARPSPNEGQPSTVSLRNLPSPTHVLNSVSEKSDTPREPDTGTLVLEQIFQKISGTLCLDGASTPIANARLHGDEISFTARGADYTGRVTGDVIEGRIASDTAERWCAIRGKRKDAE